MSGEPFNNICQTMFSQPSSSSPCLAPPTHDKPFSIPATSLKFKNPTLSLIELCTSMKELKQIHAQLLLSGLSHHTLPLSRLLAFCALASHGDLAYARLLFDTSKNPNVFMWSTMIRAYSKSTNPQLGICFYKQMLETSVVPENFTVSFALNACVCVSAVAEGKEIHAQAIKLGIDCNGFVQNGIVNFYMRIGDFVSAQQVFDRIPQPSEVCWNMMIDGYGKAGEVEFAHQMFVKMPKRGLIAWNTIVGAYASWGFVEDARRLFDRMPCRCIVSWNSLISGYVDKGEFKEVLAVFHEMQRLDVRPDKVTLVMVLSACGELGAIEQGRWIHRYVDENTIEMNVYIGTSLISMYAKTGFIESAHKVFDAMPKKDVLAWNAMIGSLAIHGRGEDALTLFAKMKLAGIAPNEITFLGVINACSHAGLVSEGRMHFESMRKNHSIEPTDKHYGCMVDLFGRAGLFIEAEELIRRIPRQPSASVWGALLGACKVHDKGGLGEQVGKFLIELEPLSDGRYVALSNVYLAGGHWAEASRLRREMNKKGIKKIPGCSMIEVDGLVHEFLVADQVHPQSEEIYSMVDIMTKDMRSTGYIARSLGNEDLGWERKVAAG